MSLPSDPPKDHHIGSPPTHFKNPWPSYNTRAITIPSLLNKRFGAGRNFVPVPKDRVGLVNIRKPTWGHEVAGNSAKLKATWIGHASWLIEFPAAKASGGGEGEKLMSARGMTVLLDPVFGDRTSFSKYLGPKRYSPLPCVIAELPQVDVVAISHNHYDHLEYEAAMELYARFPQVRFFVPLNNKAWFVGCGIAEAAVYEFDWWEPATISVEGAGSVTIVCTPAQHTSARTPFDKDKTLWSSWALCGASPTSKEVGAGSEPSVHVEKIQTQDLQIEGPRVYFAGDTGYRHVDSATPTDEEEATQPRCPAFKEIGEHLGPFDLALLPIGLYSPRNFMSSVHCSPEDSVCVHQDIRSKKTIGMHYGTFRGGISSQYEDVTEPPKRFEAACKKAGLRWGEEAGLCDLGETVIVG